MAVKWLDEPEPHHYDATSDYLTMLAEHVRVQKTVAVLRDATTVYCKAKDIQKAARLALLPPSNHIPCRLVSWP